MQNSSQLKISVGSGKVFGIRSLNSNTLSNPRCMTLYKNANDNFICPYCYSVDMLSKYRKNCVSAWQHNSDLLSGEILSTRQLPIINDRVFRFHSHGELINDTHLINFFLIARHNPETTFALWTKDKKIVRSVLRKMDKPSNLIIIFSNGVIDKPMSAPPRGFDKVFQNVSPDKDRPIQNCTGQKCIECLRCYTHGGTYIVTEAVKLRHKKRSANA
jgi:hypothetical protein